MNRNTRTLAVLAIAAVIAGLASYGVFIAVQRMPVREVEVAHTFVVAAAHPIAAGALVTEADVKLVAWPEKAMIPGAFSKVDDVVNRGALAPLLENEPLAEAKLAPVEAGAGLTPTIPNGMRAISVKVDEVIGVAGFVTPGTRVDVFVTLVQAAAQREEIFTRMVLSNVQVLAAGTRYERDKDTAAQAIPSSVVTLLLSPVDAEKVVLASNQGRLMLALRNPLDVDPTATAGTRANNLFGDAAPLPAPSAPRAAAPRPRAAVTPPPEPTPPKRYSVEAIRGAKRSEETLQ